MNTKPLAQDTVHTVQTQIRRRVAVSSGFALFYTFSLRLPILQSCCYRVDPDEPAYNEPARWDRHCLNYVQVL